jgi:hypothetical protein
MVQSREASFSTLKALLPTGLGTGTVAFIESLNYWLRTLTPAAPDITAS